MSKPTAEELRFNDEREEVMFLSVKPILDEYVNKEIPLAALLDGAAAVLRTTPHKFPRTPRR